MANNLKGITIEIGGDTTGLTDALKGVNKEAKKIQDELKDVEKALKFDPGNTELLRQKQELLTQSIQQTSQKLETLKTAQSQVQAQFERGEIGAEQYRAFQRELTRTESELTRYQNTLQGLGAEQERFEQAQRALQTYLNATGTSVEDLSSVLGSRLSNAVRDGSASVDQLELALRRIGQSSGLAGQDLEEFQRTLRNADSNSNLDNVRRELSRIGTEAEETGRTIGDSLKSGAAAGAKALAGVGVAAVGATVGVGAFVESQKEMNMDLARLRTNAETAGFGLEFIEDSFKRVAAVSGETDSAIEAVSNLMATDMSENQLGQMLDYITAGAIKFSDTLKTEGIADGIQESFAVGEATGAFAELLERSGVNLETFNEGLAVAKKNGTEVDYALKQLSETGLAATLEQYNMNNEALNAYNQAQLDSQMKLAELATVMQPFVTMLMEMGNVILDVILGNKSFAEGLGELIEIVKGLATNLFNAAKEAIPKFIQGIKDAIPQVLESGVQILTKVVEGISNTVPKLISTALDLIKKVIGTLIENLPQFLESGVKMVTSLINGITGLLPKIQQTGLELLLKLIQTIVANLPQIISAAFKIVTSLISGLMQAAPKMISYLLTTFIPSVIKTIIDADWLGIGKSIIEGLIKGIGEGAKGLLKAIGGVIGDAVGFAKNLLGINSPSKVFMQIGLWTGEGLAIGLNNSSKKVNKAMSDIGNGILAISESYLKEYLDLQNDLAEKNADANEKALEKIYKIQNNAAKKKRKLTQNELATIAKIENEYRETKLKYEKDFNQKYLALVDKSEKEYLDSIKSFVDDKKSLDQLSLVEEAAIWEQSINLFKEGTAERIKVQQNYQASVEAVNKQIMDINKNYQQEMQSINDNLIKQENDLNQAYNDAFNTRYNSLISFAGLFDEFKVKVETSGSQLLSNLQSQVDGFKLWQTEIDRLSQRGIDTDLLTELSGLGVKALPELLALNQLTDEQLTRYSELYQEKSQLAREQAEAELNKLRLNTDYEIYLLREAANNQLTLLQEEWTLKIQAITQATSTELSSLNQIGVDAAQGLLNGLASMQGPLISKATEIANAIKATIQTALDINSPSRVMKGFGVNIGEGLILGMDEMIRKVAQSSARLSSAVQSAQGSLSSSASRSMNMGAKATYSTSTTTNAPVSNIFHVTIDAKNVKEFNDIVKLMQGIPQISRAY